MKRFIVAVVLSLVSAVVAHASNGPAAAVIKLPSGVTLHYAVQGRADGKPLVLLHGIGDSWRSFELVLPYIPDRYRVYAISMRGHGWSDAPATGYEHKDFAADITAFLEALDLRRVTLVGHSLGSFVSQVVAARDTGRLDSVVLIGSGPGGAPGVAAEAREIFATMAKNPKFARDFQASVINKPVPAAFFETMVEECAEAASHMWAQAGTVADDPKTAAGLSSIKVPTLLVWGDRDSMLSRKDQDALLAAIERSRLIVYSDTGHTPHWEEPVRFAKDLLGFVGS
jgi:pimeloyl-ACP methyl ester carboxylesterase